MRNFPRSRDRRTAVRAMGAAAVMTFCMAGPSQAGPPPAATEHRVTWLSGNLAPLKFTANHAARAETVLERYLAGAAGKARAGGYSLSSLHDTGSGPVVAGFDRRVDGVPVYGARAAVVLTRDGAPVAVSLSGGPDRPFRKTIARERWALSAAEAAARAFPGGSGRLQGSKRFWAPTGAGLEPAWRMERLEPDAERGHPVLNGYLVSALDGRVLARASLTDDYRAFDYRVYADAGGKPADDAHGDVLPHPTGVPDGFVPAGAGPRPLISVAGVAGSHDDPWLPDGATGTVGNNADVFFNSLLLPDGSYDFSIGEGDPAGYGPEFAEGTGDFRAALTAPGTFDYPYDLAAAPGDFVHAPGLDPGPPDPSDPQLNAKLVQAFYNVNYLHDFFYDAGFDEAAGNAQQDNFGRGGIDGDPVIVHAGFWVTVVFTPGDGESPVIHMGRNSVSASNSDGTLDWTIFAHEWAHYMVRRLVGGGEAFLSNNQGGSLNEGWADFVGLLMSVEEDDVAAGVPGEWDGVFPVGAYFNKDYTFPLPVTGAGEAPADSYYYGIRRYPYTADMGRNPLTFAHIEHGAALPDGIPYYDWKGRSRFNSEVHTAGEVWAASLWDCYLGLLDNRPDLPFDEVRRRMAAYLVAGMKATPVDPTFTEARDGLLAAMWAGDARDYFHCRMAFARRGMGAGAVSPPRDSIDHAGVVESFDTGKAALSLLESRLDDSMKPLDGDGVLDGGEWGRLTLVVRNTGFVHLNGIRLRLGASPDFKRPGRPFVVPRLAPGEQAELAIPVKLRHDRDYDPTAFEIGYRANAPRGERLDADWSLVHRTNFDVVPTAGPDTFEFPEALDAWTVEREDGFFSYADPNWERVEHGGNGLFRAAERYAGFRTTLTSREIEVAAGTDFIIGFDHAFDFNYLDASGVEIGRGLGLVEISVDGGDWTPVGDTYGSSGPQVSPGYPALSADSINLGGTYAGQTVRVRFRALINGGFQPFDGGWLLDNVAFHGIANRPLLTVVGES